MLLTMIIATSSCIFGFSSCVLFLQWRHSCKNIVVGDPVYWIEDGAKISGIFTGWYWKPAYYPSEIKLYGKIKINIDSDREEEKEVVPSKIHLMKLPKLKAEKQLGYETYRG